MPEGKAVGYIKLNLSFVFLFWHTHSLRAQLARAKHVCLACFNPAGHICVITE